MKHGLDIAFFGSSPGRTVHGGATSYYCGVLRALVRRGSHVTFYEPDDYARRDDLNPDWARVVAYEHQGEDGLLSALTEATSADLVIKASGAGVFDETLEHAVVEMQRPGALVAFWDVDSPATLDRLNRNPEDPFRELIPEYDLILTCGGAEASRTYESLGARMCASVHHALDPALCYRVDADPRFEADLGFLGNRLPAREARIEEFFLRPASALPDRRFLLGGEGWGETLLPANVNYVGPVRVEYYNAFNSAPRAILNLDCEELSRYGFSPSARLFEAAGAGVCLITDVREGVEMFLEPGSEVLIARDGDEIIEILRSLTPERAREIGQNALRRLLAEHTYDHRADRVESLIDAKQMVFVEIA